MTLNFSKTKEIVFHRPNPRHLSLPDPISNVERVKIVKLLGVLFREDLKFDDHVSFILKICSQRLYPLKVLRSQGMPPSKLKNIFQALVVSRLTYAIPSWGGFLSAELGGKIESFLRRAGRSNLFSGDGLTLEKICEKIELKFFKSIQSPQHCLHQLLPAEHLHKFNLRKRGHAFELPHFNTLLHKKSFIIRSLYKYKNWVNAGSSTCSDI